MRIYGNRLLKTLPGPQTRPTTGKVRMALFNIWRSGIEGSSWLDLCAGNGTMGAEALCRGAKTVIGIEQSGKACAMIRDNWQRLAQPDQSWQILRGSVLKLLPTLTGQTFDWIYFDPPYASELYEPVLKAVAELRLLNPAGEMAVEYDPKQWQFLETVGNLQLIRQKKYGLSHLAFYGWQ
ncbi:MAG: 16S rRNA (guanine(966)-N(2))-methyltransferase RsmD [Synechocystis sp.]|jgi:16S rRNA (guanine(966)-N(2))-methyltransferase RsmD